HGHVAGPAHFADRGSRDREALSRWQDRPVVFVGSPAGCRLHPEYDRHSGSARRTGGAATRQSPSDDVPAHADRSAQSPPPAAGTSRSALTVQLKKLGRTCVHSRPAASRTKNLQTRLNLRYWSNRTCTARFWKEAAMAKLSNELEQALHEVARVQAERLSMSPKADRLLNRLTSSISSGPGGDSTFRPIEQSNEAL